MVGRTHEVTEGEIDFCLGALNCNDGKQHKAGLVACIENSARFKGMSVSSEVVLRAGIRAALEFDPNIRFDEIPDLSAAIQTALGKMGYNGISHSDQAGARARDGWGKGQS